jgi:PAS domain S-box-containing protein
MMPALEKEQTSRALRTINVLLIEDDPDDQCLVNDYLREARPDEFSVQSAGVLSEGLNRLSAGGIDVILLDLFLPDSTGFETFVQTHFNFSRVPIVILTGLDDEEVARRAVRAGAQDYLVKARLSGELLARSLRYSVARHGAIAELECATARLQASEKRFRQMAEAIGEVFWIASPDAGFVHYVNPAFEKLWGRSCADLYANPRLRLEMIHADDTPRVLNALAELARGRPFNIEYRVLRPDGTTCWINDRGYPQLDAAGHLTGSCGVTSDITERKRAESALAEQTARHRILFEQSPDGIVAVDPETDRILEFNNAAHEQLGYSREEFAALNLSDIAADRTPEQIHEVTERATREGRIDFEGRHRRKQGEQRIVRVTVQRTEVLGRSLLLSVWRDVTERRHAEAQLRKLSRAVEQSPASIVITNLAAEIEYVNPEFTRLTGYSLDEVCGKNPRLLQSGQTPREEYRRLWDTITHGGEWRGEFRNRKKNGELFWEFATISPIVDEAGKATHYLAVKEDVTERKRAEDTLRRQASLIDQTYDAILAWEWDGAITFWNRGAEQIYGFSRKEALGKPPRPLLNTTCPDGYDSILLALEHNSRWEGNVQQYTRDGRRIQLESRMVLVREGGRAFVLEVNRDVTQRQMLEDQLRQAQKMEAVGRLAGGVAHDFNNLLGVILGYSGLLLETTEDGPARKKLDEIRKAGQRAAGLTRQLLAFSRKQVLEPRVVCLNSLIADMEKMLHRLIGEDVHLETILDPALGQVRVDPGQIEQVIMNLAVNARDALPNGGKITIETSNAGLDEVHARQHVGMRPGSYVVIAVSDNGTGMDQETQAHIFEPFFTTKKEGTGLGLATVYGIVKQSGGNIWVYSEPAKGSAFKIYLPRLDQAAEKPQNNSEAVHLPGGTETILVVEDAEPVRAVAREFLELGGYTVLSASCGTEALEIAARRDVPIHLLLTDVIMPEMSGPQLAEKLRALRGETKVLFMSGYTDAALAQHGVLETGKLLIMKPFSRETLTQKVREALSAV